MDQEFDGQGANRGAAGVDGTLLGRLKVIMVLGYRTESGFRRSIPHRALLIYQCERAPRSILNGQTFGHQQTRVQIRISDKERG